MALRAGPRLWLDQPVRTGRIDLEALAQPQPHPTAKYLNPTGMLDGLSPRRSGWPEVCRSGLVLLVRPRRWV